MKRTVLILLALCFYSGIPAAEKSGRFTFIPIIFYTPETSAALGLSPLYLFPQETEGKQSNLVGLFIYTLNKQTQGFVNWTHYFAGGSIILKSGIYGKHFPSKFYGIGDATREGDEESFLEDSIRLESGILFRLRKNLFAGIQYEYEGISIGDIEGGGLLDSGSVPGSGGSRVSGFGTLVSLDTTDDNFYPTRGLLLDWKFMCYAGIFGGDREYSSLTLDNRLFAGLGDNRVLAFRLLGEFAAGDVPFNRMAMLGGAKILRGYYEGRFREKNLVSLTAEYRSPLYKRLGFALFAGLGTVSPDLAGFSDALWKYTFGAGLRFRLRKDSKLNMRLDIGFNHEAFGVYIIGLEAF